jgi:aminopeptidase
LSSSEITSEDAKRLLVSCLDLKRSDHVLIICDSPNLRKALVIKRTAEEMGCQTKFIRITPIELELDDLPLPIYNEIRASQVAVACLSPKYASKFCRGESRIGSFSVGAKMGFLTSKLSQIPKEPDLLLIAKRAAKIADVLSKSVTAEIETSTDGDTHHFRFSLEGRKPFRFTPLITQPGAWGILSKQAVVRVAPVEGSSEGSFVANLCATGVGSIKQPMTLLFSKGRLEKVEGGKEAEKLNFLLAGQDFNSKMLGGVGIGTNHLLTKKNVKPTFNIEEEDNRLGVVSLSIGNNLFFGGKNVSKSYVEVLNRNASVRTNGNEIIRNGELLFRLTDL